MPRIRIRPLRHPDEFQECERLQEAVWGMLGVASELLIVTQKCGGLVLGAFTGEKSTGKLVGFICAFLAQRRGELIHWSHQMAIRDGYRNRGVGFRLKLAHRRIALARGLRSICWTFDPLQSRNASLNIARLGARVEEYLEDFYGHFPSIIEKGLPTDRLLVNWKIDSRQVKRRLESRPKAGWNTPFGRGWEKVPLINATRCPVRAGFLHNEEIRLGLRAPRLLFEIPSNTDEMRRRALALACRWRMETRRIFKHYFARGYRVADFYRTTMQGRPRYFYALQKEN